MNTIDELINKIFSISIWDVAKVSVLLFLFLYILFSVVVIRQINLMIQTLDGNLNLPLRVIAWLHFIFALFVFLLALLIL